MTKTRLWELIPGYSYYYYSKRSSSPKTVEPQINNIAIELEVRAVHSGDQVWMQGDLEIVIALCQYRHSING